MIGTNVSWSFAQDFMPDGNTRGMRGFDPPERCIDPRAQPSATQEHSQAKPRFTPVPAVEPLEGRPASRSGNLEPGPLHRALTLQTTPVPHPKDPSQSRSFSTS